MFNKETILGEPKYRPICILPSTSEVMECVINNQMCAYFYDILDIHLSAFRKNYNTQSILVKVNIPVYIGDGNNEFTYIQ